jgi:hypothetical protein
MGISGHYVNENDVVDFLGYEIKTIDPAEYEQFGDVIGEIFDDTCAVLLRQQNLILLSNKLFPRRKRITIYHECGHDILPWHQANAFSIRGKSTGVEPHGLSLSSETQLAEWLMAHYAWERGRIGNPRCYAPAGGSVNQHRMSFRSEFHDERNLASIFARIPYEHGFK